MNAAFENIELIKNRASNRFELTVDGHIAFIDYNEREKVISLIHTESPIELAGRGVATALIEKTLQYLEDNGYTLLPLCPLVFAFIKRHKEWARIVSEDFKSKFEA